MATLLELLWSEAEQYRLMTESSVFVIYLCVILAYFLTTVEHRIVHVLVSAMLALVWIWLGGVFWLSVLGSVRPALFWGVLFLLQGYLFLVYGVLSPRLCYRSGSRMCQWSAAVCMAAAMVGYPLLTLYGGQLDPRIALVGLLPGPTVLFTMAFLLLLRPPRLLHLAVIPCVWAAAGLSWISLSPAGEGLVFVTTFVMAAVLVLEHRREKTTELMQQTAL